MLTPDPVVRLTLDWAMFRISAVASLALAAALTSVAAAQPASLSPIDMSVRTIKRAITPVRDGSDLVMLSALRQMRDPTLRPLFERLTTQNTNPQAQVHSLLALAELEEDGKVTPLLIRQLQSPEGRLQAVTAAIADDRLTPEQCAELASAPELDPLPRLWLLAELIRDGREFDRAYLASLASSPNIDVAGFASLLMLSTGEPGAFTAYQQRFADYKRSATSQDVQLHRSGMFDVVHQYKITQAAPWVIEQLDDPSLPEPLVDEGLRSLFAVDPASAVERWSQAIGAATSPAHQLRLALILLGSDATVPASTYDALLSSDYELIQRLGAVGHAAAQQKDIDKALIDLIASDHPRATAWALEYASNLPPEQSIAVYEAAVRRAESAREFDDPRVTTAADAAARLYRIKPEAAIALLAAAPRDSRQQEAILLGMTVTGDARAADAAAAIERTGLSRADALALILIARHAESLSPADLKSLGVIASGGAHISDTLQTQAAWLFIRHSAKMNDALTAIFDTAGESNRR
jgi:hypothetical protein